MDFSVPQHLIPPSQAQRDAQALQQERINQINREQYEQMFTRIKQRSAMTRMMSDADTLQAAGFDPLTARATALSRHAGKLFEDDPEKGVRIALEADTMLRRNRAITNYRQRVQELTAGGADPIDAFSRAVMENPELAGNSFGQFMGTAIASDQRRDIAKMRNEFDLKKLDESARYHRDLIEKANADREQKQSQFDTRMNLSERKLDEDQYQFDTTAAQRDLAASKKLSDADRQKVSDLYKQAEALDKQRLSLHPQKDAERRFRLSVEAGNLKKQISKIVGDQADDRQPAKAEQKQSSEMKAGAVVEQGGKRYRFKGGDPNLASSYDEVK